MVTPVYKHHNNTIRLTIQYKAALTTCERTPLLQYYFMRVVDWCVCSVITMLRGRLQRTSGKWGGGGFKISEGGGGGLLKFGRPKISEKIELQNFSELFKLKL